MPTLYDITLPVHPQMLIYSHDPAPVFKPIQTITRDGNATSLLHIGTHCGTHVDAPNHFVVDGIGVDQIPLNYLLGPGKVIELLGKKQITAADLQTLDLGERVFFRTDNSVHQLLQQPRYQADFVGLTADAATLLVQRGVKLMGVDYLSCENPESGNWIVHKTLLAAGIVIVESCNLTAVAAGLYNVTVLPLRLHNLDASPCRAVLEKEI